MNPSPLLRRVRRASSLGCVLAVTLAGLTLPQAHAADLISFWNTPQRGANSFNDAAPDQAYFSALAATGATWVRLTFSKWQGEDRDFLIGNADQYVGLKPKDLAILHTTLDAAHAAGLRVVLSPLSLPGARWRQQHDRKLDDRIWSDPAYPAQAAQFWRDLASALKDHPAIAAYNLINEPVPEAATGLKENAAVDVLQAWQRDHAGGPRDVLRLYEHLIDAIREVDTATPIMVDSGWYANARSLAAWPRPLKDAKVLYAFHMYEPYEATSAPNMQRKQPLRYPGVTTSYSDGQQKWDRQSIAAHIALPYKWASEHGIDQNRIVAAEFGCMRRWPDCRTYLTDVLDALDTHDAHWAFYSFREDGWDGMDYELPPHFKPGQFYWLSEQQRAAEVPRDGELMTLLKARMVKGRRPTSEGGRTSNDHSLSSFTR